MAAESRPRRENAGRNIGKLISQEEDGGDEFYTTAYGGFEEESEDEEYESEASEEDQVDSDFDVDETEWGPGDDEEERIRKDEKKKAKQWVKPFKQPQVQSFQPLRPPKPKKKCTVTTTSSIMMDTGTTERRTFRKSTQEISRGFQKRREEEEEMKQWRTVRRPRKVKRQLTHEEMLEEAKWTELENLASLEAYTRTMAEKKKVKTKKVAFQGPVVRYLSVAMPLVQDADVADCSASAEGEKGEEQKEREEKKEGEGERGGLEGVVPIIDSTKDSQDSGIGTVSASGESVPVSMETSTGDTGTSEDATNTAPDTTPTSPKPHPPPLPPAKQSRNFMIFTDTNNFPSAYFPRRTKRSRPRRKLCPVTGLPAKYVDPLTRTPYATPFAFKVIRMRYVSEAEEKCEKRLIQLSNWLEEKKKKKMEIT